MKIRVFFLLCFVVGHVWAQDIVIKTTEGTAVNGQTILVNANININYDSAIEEFVIENTSSGSLDVKVRKEYIDIVPETSNTFCWGGSCLPAFLLESSPVAIAAGAEYDDFSAHYNCMGLEGTSIVKFYFFEEGGPEEFIIIEFTASNTAVSPITSNKNMAYPNPAKTTFTISTEKRDMQIKVYDVLGNLIRSFTPGELTTQVDCSSWSNGVYFVRSFDDNKLVNTQKLVVAH